MDWHQSHSSPLSYLCKKSGAVLQCIWENTQNVHAYSDSVSLSLFSITSTQNWNKMPKKLSFVYHIWHIMALHIFHITWLLTLFPQYIGIWVSFNQKLIECNVCRNLCGAFWSKNTMEYSYLQKQTVTLSPVFSHPSVHHEVLPHWLSSTYISCQCTFRPERGRTSVIIKSKQVPNFLALYWCMK